MDTTGLQPGEDFARALEQRVRECGTMIVLIDRRWAGAGPGTGSRLLDPSDWVRFEVGLALALGRRVLPVLVDGASMPAPEALPSELRGLLQLQAFELRSSRLDADAWDLAGQVVVAAGGSWPPPERGAGLHGVLSALYTVYVGLVLMVLMVAAIFADRIPVPQWLGIVLLVTAVALVLRLPLFDALARLSRAAALEYAAFAHAAGFALLVYGEGKGDPVLMTIFGVFPAALLYVGAGAARKAGASTG